MDDADIERIAKAFHESYFRKFWGDEGRKNPKLQFEYNPERDGWEKFDNRHKIALRSAFKDIIEKELVVIPVPNVSKPHYRQGD